MTSPSGAAAADAADNVSTDDPNQSSEYGPDPRDDRGVQIELPGQDDQDDGDDTHRHGDRQHQDDRTPPRAGHPATLDAMSDAHPGRH